jgi:hypothetical protein
VSDRVRTVGVGRCVSHRKQAARGESQAGESFQAHRFGLSRSAWPAPQAEKAPYPAMAPVDEYLTGYENSEIAHTSYLVRRPLCLFTLTFSQSGKSVSHG